MTSTITTPQIFSRQMGLFNPDKHQKRVIILGVGATGSFTALALAKMGIQDIQIWDADYVEMHNCPNQLHRWSDLGRSKVDATKDIVHSFCDGLDQTTPNIQTFSRFFEEEDDFGQGGIVICAADSMAARAMFWEKVKRNMRVDLYIDPRVGGQIIHMYCLDPFNPEHAQMYESTLHSDEESSELPCGERATSDMSFLVASRICRAVRRFAVDETIEPFIMENAQRLETINVFPTKE
jgi:hypothetical protein